MLEKTDMEKTDMNSIYIKLFNIVEEDINYAHSNLENIFPDWDEVALDINYFHYSLEYQYETYINSCMKGNFIQPYIYRDLQEKNILYKPFLNLYSAHSEMEEIGINWDLITKRMNTCYGIVEDRFHRFGADGITSYPHKKFIDQVENTLKLDSVKKDDNKGKLTLYLKSGRIVFNAPSGNTYQTQIGRHSNGYLLLKYLMLQQSGLVLPYSELAKHINKSRANIDSDDKRRVRDAVGHVKKSLNLKTNDNPFVTDSGFGLSCSSHIEQTE